MELRQARYEEFGTLDLPVDDVQSRNKWRMNIIGDLADSDAENGR